MGTNTRTLGGLVCREYDELPENAAPQLLVVLCHGFGAPGSDLVSLAPEIIRRRPELAERVRFVFPEAPLSLAAQGMPGGRAWWLLDIEELTMSIERGELRNLREDHPPELPAAREQFVAMLETLTEETQIPMSRVALGGFSQGSMLATDVALRVPEAPGELVILSGSLLSEDEWRELAKNRGPLNVFQSHGQQDPILPFEASQWLRDLLSDAGMTVEFLPFAGMHQIPPAAIERIAERLLVLCEAD